MADTTNIGELAPRSEPQATAYNLLRDDLLAGRFEPGAKLRVEELSARYGIGASPLREALARLAESGLVMSELQRGYWVAPISLAEYRDLVETRVKLECQALTQSIENGDVEWEARVVAAYHRLARAHARLTDGAANEFVDWARADRAFHAATIDRCGSMWMLRFCQMISDQTSRYHRQQHFEGIAPVDQTQREHERLMKAVIDRDVARARACLEAHIRNVARRVERGAFAEHG